MENLNFKLPDFTRISWVSEQARQVWEPRLRRIANAWSEIEWQSVVHGVRACCLTTVTPEEFVLKAGRVSKKGLTSLPLQLQGLSNYSYASNNIQPELGKPFGFRIVIGSPQHVSDFQNAYDSGNDQEIGKLLGFPNCCIQFFRAVWVEQQLVDTTWPMAEMTDSSVKEDHLIEVTGLPESNILWRWMGVRTVPHLPCNFNCSSTVQFGQQLLNVGREAGFNAEMDWMLEILNWPIEWSALHGIAEIKTPILKVTTCTDATPVKYVVRRVGKSPPPETAKGLTFPYQTPRKPLLTQSVTYQRGLEHPIHQPDDSHRWYASDNGFDSSFAMDLAHKPLVELALNTLSSNKNILDLGCGNGALLKKISEANSEIIPFGIERELDRLEHARKLLTEFEGNFIWGDMFAENPPLLSDRRYGIAILMPGRMIEVGEKRSLYLKRWLKKNCDHLLVYAYGDWLTRYQDFAGLVQEAGLTLITPSFNDNLGLAKL